MSAFGFDVSNVFGDGGFGSARKGRKSGKKSKKVKDDFDCLNCDDQGFGGLDIDTFSLAEPDIDSLGIGSDFGSQIGSRAGLSNGKSGGFLDTIGSQQVRVPSVTGRGSVARGRGRGRKSSPRAKGRTPLQRSTGTRFGDVDREFSGNVIGNLRGAKKRISAFRAGRKKSKTKSTRDTPQLPFNQPALISRQERPIAVSNGEQLALPAPRRPDTVPRESGSSAIQRLREAEERRSAT